MQRTLDEVRQEGLAALCERLGRADTVRFLQQFETGRGDYARERQEWVDSLTMSDLEQEALTGRRADFNRHLNAVPDVAPDENDRME